jgi:hypothetical protein
MAGSTCTLSADLAISATLTTVTWTAYYATTTADTFGSLASPTVTQIATGTFTVTSTVTNFSANISVPAAATTGIQILFTVGALTAGLTWTIGNVQFEKGSTATSFDYRPYGTELALCQRYYYKVVTAGASSEVLANSGFNDSTTSALCWTQFPVSMRINPTALEQTGTAANYQLRIGGTSVNCSSVPTFNVGSLWGARTTFTVASGLTTGQSVMAQTAATAGIYLAWGTEL